MRHHPNDLAIAVIRLVLEHASDDAKTLSMIRELVADLPDPPAGRRDRQDARSTL